MNKIMKYWKKGALIGLIISIIYTIIFFSLFALCFSDCKDSTYTLSNLWFALNIGGRILSIIGSNPVASFYIFGHLVNIVLFSIIGALVGIIVKKIKHK